MALLAVSRRPVMDNAMPRTLALLRAEWVSKNLGDFVPHVSWGIPLNAAVAKRRYLMDFIKLRRQADGSSLIEAAAAVDRDRLQLSKTVPQFLEYLKSRDDMIWHRV